MLRMIRRWLSRVPGVVVLVGLALQVNCAGQSDDNRPSCSKLCQKGLDECPLLPRVDCESQCLYEDARAEKTGCQREVDAVASCSSELDDICTTVTACDDELDEFWDCIGAYCSGHPSSQYCEKSDAG